MSFRLHILIILLFYVIGCGGGRYSKLPVESKNKNGYFLHNLESRYLQVLEDIKTQHDKYPDQYLELSEYSIKYSYLKGQGHPIIFRKKHRDLEWEVLFDPNLLSLNFPELQLEFLRFNQTGTKVAVQLRIAPNYPPALYIIKNRVDVHEVEIKDIHDFEWAYNDQYAFIVRNSDFGIPNILSKVNIESPTNFKEIHIPLVNPNDTLIMYSGGNQNDLAINLRSPTGNNKWFRLSDSDSRVKEITLEDIFLKKVLSKRDALYKKVSRHEPVPKHSKFKLIFSSYDNSKIPITIIKPKNKNLTNKILLRMYGAYGEPLDIKLDRVTTYLLNLGVTIAFIPVRGDGSLGESWIKQGKGCGKIGAVRDLIEGSNALVKNRVVDTPKNITIESWSAGATTVLAAINIEPGIAGSIIVTSPFIDVLGEVSNSSKKLNSQEVAEWGDPKTDLHCIKEISPALGLKPQAYPEILLIAGKQDPTISYISIQDWIKRFQQITLSPNSLNTLISDKGDHSGAASIFEGQQNDAWKITFIAK